MSPDLELVVTFLQSRHDANALATPGAVADWLGERGLLTREASVTPDNVRQLWRLRAALNALIANRDVVEERTRQTIEAAAGAAPLQFRVGPTGALEAEAIGEAMDSAIAGIIAAFYRCQLRGEIDRLKACRGCGYAFVDVSKNQSRVWCDMALCGSPAKARAYRQRKADEARIAQSVSAKQPTD